MSALYLIFGVLGFFFMFGEEGEDLPSIFFVIASSAANMAYAVKGMLA